MEINRRFNGEATMLASVVTSAANMLKRGKPLQWHFGPEPSGLVRRNDRMSVDIERDPGTIDPSTWPTAQRFIEMQQRMKAASEKVAKAYDALSPAEKSFVQNPKPKPR